MPRYFFHLVSSSRVLKDRQGTTLRSLSAAHWYAVKLVYYLHANMPEAKDDWIVEVADENGTIPLVVLPTSDPMKRLLRFSGDTADRRPYRKGP
jgi:hypothetical protein